MDNYQDMLPSFREQLAIVYNDYMDTLGGGERSALAYAKGLQSLGFTTEIVSTRPIPNSEEIVRIFGDEFSGIRMRTIKTDNVYEYLLPAEPAIFVNHTYMSFSLNPAKVGIYSQMFPGISLSSRTHRREMASIGTYQLILSNSSYTQRYSDAYWSVPEHKSFILNPPIGSGFVKIARDFLNNFPQKEKCFAHVGRFNPGNHNKNQEIIIEAFLEAKSKFPILKDWSLKLIGNANQTPDALRYHNRCKELAARSAGQVKILSGISSSELSRQLKSSFGYVHATGAFLAPGVAPEKCEHFGLGIIEAMAHGAIPLVYARGGIFDVMTPGESGFPYITYDGLVEGFAEVATLWDNPRRNQIQSASLQAAAQMGQDDFTKRLLSLIKQVMFS